MLELISQHYLLVISGVIALVGITALIVVLWKRSKKRAGKPSPQYKEFDPAFQWHADIKFNTMIEDRELGTVHAYIDWPEEPTRLRRYNGEFIYYMKCAKGKLKQEKYSGFAEAMIDNIKPIEPPQNIGNTPEQLWIVLHRFYDLVPIVNELPPPEWLLSMMKYAVISLAIGALIFIIAKGK